MKFSSIPVKVPIKEKVKSIASGQMHALALTVDGILYCWGHNNGDVGAVGIGSNVDIISTPQRAPIEGSVTSIEAGGGHTFVMTKEGKIYGWGANTYGQLGLGNKENQVKPIEIKPLNTA